jgi:PAS domain S-box-containing protein
VPDRDSDALLRALYDTLPDLILVLDRDGIVHDVHVGGGLEGVAERAQLVGRKLAELLPPTEVEARLSDLAEIFEAGYLRTQYETTFGGINRFVEARGSAFEPDRALVVVRNLTDAQQALQKLRSSQDHLRAIYDAFPDMISISNREGVVVELRLGDMHPARTIDADSIVGHSFTEFLTPEESDRQLALQERALAGEMVNTEYKVTIDGMTGWAESSGVRLDDDHVLWVTRDVTGRHEAEQELRESEDRYRNIVETAAEGIMALDENFCFTFVNERAEEMLGYAHGELIGVPLRDVIPPTGIEMAQEARRRRATGVAERFEAQLVRRDGSTIWVLVSARPRYDDDGKFAGSFSMVADISELKRTAEEHRKLLQRIGAAEDDERRRLAEGLHDGPIQDLAAMALRLGTLRLGMGHDEERAGRVREIEDAIRTSIGDLRDLMFALQPAEPGGDGLATSLRTCASVVFQDDVTAFEVNAHLDDEPPPRVASTTYRIAREALVNARRHAAAAHVVVNLATVQSGISLEVVDDGRGIPPDVLEHGVAGHLGLRTMRERATAEGGFCTITSEGRGTRVAVWLPLSGEAPVPGFSRSSQF